MSLVRVWTNVGEKKPKALLAKIFSSAEGPVYTIRYLSSFSEGGRSVYRYENDTYEVDDDSISEWLGVDDEEDIGYTCIGDEAWIKGDMDSDYVPDSSEEDDSTDEEEEEDEATEDEDFPEDDDAPPEENDDYD